MSNLLYIVALILIVLWLIGFMSGTVGGLIHVLLVLAVVAILLRLVRGSDPL